MTRPILQNNSEVFNYLLIPNTPVGPLLSGESYTGEWIECYQWDTLILSMKTDVAGTLFVDFSVDAINADSTISYDVTGGLPEGPHRLTIGRRYMRIRYQNDSTDQTYWRLQVIAGNHPPVTSVLGSTIKLDADAQIVRSLPAEFEISRDTIEGIEKNNKVGKNSNVPNSISITSPAFITEQGGFYTGFPTGAAEKVRVVSTSASDTSAGAGARAVRVLGLNEDWDLATEVIPLNGTTAVESSGFFRRIHSMFITESGSPTAMNIGTISVFNFPTTANIFATILPNVGSSNYAVYTVPRNYVGVIRNTSVEVRRAQSGSIDGSYWIRTLNNAPRYRRPFSASNVAPHRFEPYAGVTFPEMTDIALVCTYASNNGLVVVGRFDIILISTIL